MKKIDIGQMKYLLREMEVAQKEHPKAKIYYDAESNEIRITYPLPNDFRMIEGYVKNIQN